MDFSMGFRITNTHKKLGNKVKIRKNENQIVFYVCKDIYDIKKCYVLQLANTEKKTHCISIFPLQMKFNDLLICTLLRCNYE